MLQIRVTLAIAAATLGLAACNDVTGGAPPQTSVVAGGPTVPGVPSGSACGNEIGRYQQVVKDDLATGNVEQKVYDQIQRELSRASAACAAGRGSEAHAIVSASKAKHGYRA